MKSKRQDEILAIITQQEVETQEQLLECLKERGIATTQATISRDIKQLHLVKELTSGGVYKYAVSHHRTALNFAGRLLTIFREGVMSYDKAQNIVVIKTLSGLGNGVAEAIDGMDIPNMVGSLAGDNTILLIMRDNESAVDVCEQIREILN